MKNFLKLTALILALLMMAAVAVSADTVDAPVKYDPMAEGIISSYYSIDYERGYIMGIAPGTTAEKLRSVCLPGVDMAISQDMIMTGTTVTATVTVVTEPETQPTEPSTVPPSTETLPPTEPSTETTVPPEETTTTPPEETTAQTTPPEETTAETTPPEETTTQTTVSTETTAAVTQTTDASQASENNRMLSRTVETKTFTLTAIVTGDLNGDGAVTITDMLMVKSAVLGSELSEAAAVAGDVNYDGNVTITDFLQLKSHLLNISAISAGKVPGITPKDPLILMVPGEARQWGAEGAVTYTTDNGAVAAVDAAGVIVAGGGEGSTFVYALDGNGTVLSRAVVTVLNEKLTVSIGAESHKLMHSETLKLSASFNHPVTAAVSWASSDPNVVSVDAEGNITTPNPGTAVVTATLDNGSQAQTTVTVVPPITSISIDKSLYKVRPGATRALTAIMDPAETGEVLEWSSSNPAVATVGSDGVVTGVSYGTTAITVKGKYSGLTATCHVKVCDAKYVAITFDDGPSGYTPTLLSFLEENDIRATFFLVGNRVNRYPETVKRIAASGSEIGYHSYNHVEQTSLPSEQVTAEFNVSNNELYALTGRTYTVWRTPGGGRNDRVLNCVPLPHIMWSVDTLDWQTLNTDAVYSAVRGSKDGTIILLHDLYSSSVNGAIKAMREMNAGDYEFMTVTELLSRNGTPPKPSTTYFSG